MKNKWFFFSILIVAEILVLTAIVLVVNQGVTQTDQGAFGMGIVHTDLFSAESDEEWSFEAGEMLEISLESSGGDVTFETGDVEEIQVTAHKTAWNSTKTRAQQELDDFSISVSQVGTEIIINYHREPDLFWFGTQKTDVVDFIITIPSGMEISAQTDFGDITTSGNLGDAFLTTDFGNIDHSGSGGNFTARSNSGDITVEEVNGKDNRIDLLSDFGTISLNDSSGKSVEIHSNSGAIVLVNVTAVDKIELSSDFGKLEIDEVKSDNITMETNSGKIRLSRVTAESNLIINNDFGDIILEKTAASIFDLHTNSGKIEANISGGDFKGTSDFGDIYVHSSQPTTLDLFTNSGSVEFAGPLGDGPHSIMTDFGDITLSLPRDVKINFDLETDFGMLHTAFPITLEGDVEKDHWTGIINEGGDLVIANTNSGDISLEFLTH